MAQITKGISITVRTAYRPEYSDPSSERFVFSYRITIENHNDFEVQLLRRHWDIFDSHGVVSIVDGEGVIGEKPVIRPGGLFAYESSCHLESGIGRMKGYYEMMRTGTGKFFRAEIPEFLLEAPFLLN